MNYATVQVNGYWVGNSEPFEDVTVALGDWDGVEGADDESIFFYLNGAPIIGNHGDFVITGVTE
jgi:hypothetical protein